MQSNKIRVVNIKGDMPSVDQARQRLKQVLADALRDKAVVLKLIHGYGSSGVGGALKGAIRNSLRHRKKEGVIADFVPGESWSIFDPTSQKLMELCPQLGKDSDLDRCNQGITIILLGGQEGAS